MNYDGTPVKAPPASRRKIMPPAPQWSLQPSIEAKQLQMEMKDQESGSCEIEYANVGGRLVMERLSQEWSST